MTSDGINKAVSLHPNVGHPNTHTDRLMVNEVLLVYQTEAFNFPGSQVGQDGRRTEVFD